MGGWVHPDLPPEAEPDPADDDSEPATGDPDKQQRPRWGRWGGWGS
jgi:hypothetical protein